MVGFTWSDCCPSGVDLLARWQVDFFLHFLEARLTCSRETRCCVQFDFPVYTIIRNISMNLYCSDSQCSFGWRNSKAVLYADPGESFEDQYVNVHVPCIKVVYFTWVSAIVYTAFWEGLCAATCGQPLWLHTIHFMRHWSINESRETAQILFIVWDKYAMIITGEAAQWGNTMSACSLYTWHVKAWNWCSNFNLLASRASHLDVSCKSLHLQCQFIYSIAV